MSSPTETLEQWAARVAMELDTDGWREADAVWAYLTDLNVCGYHWCGDWCGEYVGAPPESTESRALALLACRAKVATGLYARSVATLRSEGRTEEASLWSDLDRLVEYGLLDQDHRRTNFGREILRALEVGDE